MEKMSDGGGLNSPVGDWERTNKIKQRVGFK